MSEEIICERCNYAHHDQECEHYGVNTSQGHQTWCEDCCDGFAFYCDDCAEFHAISAGHSIGDAFLVCEDCFDSSYYHCHQCDENVHDGHDCPYGFDEEDETYGGLLHSYGFKPSPIFYGEGPRYFGVELEIESHPERIVEVLEYLNGHGIGERVHYQKSDSSLAVGPEIVFHPRSLESWQEYGDELASMLWELRGMQARAWDRSSCGLHVHVSRDGFRSVTSVAAFALLVSRNKGGLVDFAGRESTCASFEELSSRSVVEKARRLGGGHYDAVNLSNYSTVELRIFRPSLAAGRVLAAVELTDALVAYSGTISAHDITLGALEWGRFVDFVRASDRWPHAVHVLGGGRFQAADTLAASFVSPAGVSPCA